MTISIETTYYRPSQDSRLILYDPDGITFLFTDEHIKLSYPRLRSPSCITTTSTVIAHSSTEISGFECFDERIGPSVYIPKIKK